MRNLNLFQKTLKLLGLSLTSLSITFFLVNYSAPLNAYYEKKIISPFPTPKPIIQSVPKTSRYLVKDDSVGAVMEEARAWGVDTSFSIVIPKIEAKSKIIPNVDPFDDNQYKDALKKGIAHAKNTYFPGQGRGIFLFAHSTDSSLNVADYNAVFFRLRELEMGDQLIIFRNNKKFEYKVTHKFIAEPSETSWLIPKDKEELILQTCDPPGTAKKRLLIIATPLNI